MSVAELFIVNVDPSPDGSRGAEIEGCAIDRCDPAGGDQHAVDGCRGLGVDPQFVTEYRAAALAAEVEERVVREVDDGGAVGPGAVTDPEGVVVGDGVGHLYGQFAGIPLFAVGRHVVHDDRIGGVRIDGPYAAVEPFHTSVQ